MQCSNDKAQDVGIKREKEGKKEREREKERLWLRFEGVEKIVGSPVFFRSDMPLGFVIKWRLFLNFRRLLTGVFLPFFFF